MHIYDYIRLDLNLSYVYDYQATVVLSELIRDLSKPYVVEGYLEDLMKDSKAYVVGAGPKCIDELRNLSNDFDVLIAADGALRCCLDAGYLPDVVVTDLDGLNPDELRYRDIIYVIHAHGDNIDKLLKYVKLVRGPVIGTSQCIPYGGIKMYGGFTDGDRAAYLAYYFGAKYIKFLGFDLDSGVVGRYSKPWMVSDLNATLMKLRKFKWAKRLINLLRVCSEGVLIEQ